MKSGHPFHKQMAVIIFCMLKTKTQVQLQGRVIGVYMQRYRNLFLL